MSLLLLIGLVLALLAGGGFAFMMFGKRD
jgi:hypothetical protein